MNRFHAIAACSASIIMAMFISINALAADITIAWDPNSEAELAGYNLYYGTASGNYATSVNVGNQTHYTLSNLQPDTIYYIAATAYDTTGQESAFSVELIHHVPPEPNDSTPPDINPPDDSDPSDPQNPAPSPDPDTPPADTTPNQPPVANAGPDQTVSENSRVTLSAASSVDLDDGIAAYAWTQVQGTTVDILNADSSQASFVAPDVDMAGESLIFQLLITDAGDNQATDECIINVSWVNLPPMADAGENQSVPEGSEVILNGLNSFDADDQIASYVWTQIDGPAVELQNATQPKAYFYAPDRVDLAGESYTFQLTVTDSGRLMATDTCIVTVSWQNDAPIAHAGSDQAVISQNIVFMDGSGSFDRDDGIKSVQWAQISGMPVSLSDPTSITPFFTAPGVLVEKQKLTFRITVTDAGGLTSSDTCTLTVDPAVTLKPILDLKANRSDGLVTVNANRKIDLTAAVNAADYEGMDSEWWLGALTPDGFVMLNQNGEWVTEFTPFYSGKLVSADATSILKERLPKGDYTFIFAIDVNINGQVDNIDLDTVSVSVK